MAESGGSATASASETGGRTKFFCHQCNDEVPHVLADFTCPVCKGGFIEELHEMETSASSSTGSLDGGQPSLNDFIGQILRGLSDPGAVVGREGGHTFQRTRSADGPIPRFNPNPRNYGTRQFSFVVGGPTSNLPGRDGEPPMGGGGRSQSDQPPLVENMLFGFLNDLITGLGGGVPVGGAPVISNLGDYAWGPGGLDAIVTELMNQMEGTGPPPLPTERIENLPDVKISAEQVERKLQCSVCWDDFKLDELVKKLDCEHVYHPDCIIPWLKLHGTCPVCRKDLNGEVQDKTKTEEPEPRFELFGAPPGANNSAGSNNRSSRNPSTRPQQTARSHSAPGNNPMLQSLNQILDPLLTGLSAASGSGPTNPAASNNQPNRGRQGDGSQQPGNQRPGSGQGFDNMDLDFD